MGHHTEWGRGAMGSLTISGICVVRHDGCICAVLDDNNDDVDGGGGAK